MRNRALSRRFPAGLLALAAALAVWLAPAGAAAEEPANLRAIVVAQGDDDDVELLRQIRALGFNAIVGNGPAKLSTALAARDAGLSYLAFISSGDAARLETDAESLGRMLEIAGVGSFAGFHYLDDAAEEGYTSPAAQARVYSTMKRLFPGKLVLHALRADLVASDTRYLDDNFHPENTDLVVPYFYPVGSTMLGSYGCDENWEATLFGLLARVRERMAPGKGILPVLQGFEQSGFSVDEDFPRRQLDVYTALWPENGNVASFAWFTTSDALTGMAASSTLQGGFRRLLETLVNRPRAAVNGPCEPDLSTLPCRCRPCPDWLLDAADAP